MPESKLTCPSCRTTLKTARPMPPGSRLKCPKCGQVFAVPGPSAGPAKSAGAIHEAPSNPMAPRAVPSAGSASPDKPAANSKPPAVTTKPKAAPPPPEPELDEDDAPARPRKKPKSGAGLLVLLAVVGLVLLGGGGATVAVCWDILFPTTQVSKGPVGAEAHGEARIPEPLPEAPPLRPEATLKVELPYLTPNFNAAAIIQPKHLLKSPLVGALGVDELLAQLPEAQGLGPNNVEQVIVYIEPVNPFGGPPYPGPTARPQEPVPVTPSAGPTPRPPGQGEPQRGFGLASFGGAVVVRFDKPVPQNAVWQFQQDAKKTEFQGKVYYKSELPLDNMTKWPLCTFVDDRTLVVAPEPTLQQMLTATDVQGPLADRLKAVRPDDDVTVVFVVVDTYSKLIALGMLGIAEMDPPPGFGDIRSVLPKVVSVSLALNFTDERLAWVAMETKDEESATKLEEMARKTHQLAREAYPKAREELTRAGGYSWLALAIGDQVETGASITRENRQVMVTLNRPERFTNLPKNLVAATGFNDQKGLWSDPVADSPYSLGGGNHLGGEPGWAGPWKKTGQSIVQQEVVQEGDGALLLKGPDAVRLSLASPESGQLVVEQFVRVPEGGDLQVSLRSKEEGGRGPTWLVKEGKFMVIDFGKAEKPVDTGVAVETGKWHKVTVTIDAPKGTWELVVDGKKGGQAYTFGTKGARFDGLQLGAETEPGAYVDAIQMTRVGPPPLPALPGFPPGPPIPRP